MKMCNALPLFLLLACFGTVFSQSSSATISGAVTDENGAVVPGAAVTAKNSSTRFTRSATTDSSGHYRLALIPTGTYELTIDASSFPKYLRRGIILEASQNAIVDAVLKTGKVEEVVTVSENASVLNSTSAEISTRFDSRRLSELPIAPNRNVLNILLSVPGVSQLSGGQTSYATGISFSVNGGRIRSNNFMIDGQDVNDAVFTGTGFALNNPDAIEEVRIVTNQFTAEYGRNSGSVVNFVGRSGTNDYHGSLFWFHNNEYLNACSNLDKVASFAPTGYCNRNAVTNERRRAPKRLENQVGVTFGGPLTLPRFGDSGGPAVWKGTDKTFVFGDYQRWADRSQNSGTTLTGAPTAEGRSVLRSIASDRPQVQALLDFVPAGTPNGRTATFRIGDNLFTVPLGDLTGSTPFVFDDSQGSIRVDHRLDEKNLIYGRYRFDLQQTTGDGQVTPPGLTVVRSNSSAAATIVINSILTNKLSNEARIAWSRFNSTGDAENPLSKTIPSIDILGLGMVTTNAVRTAIGFPTTLPGARRIHTYQFADAISYFTSSHSVKVGIELRWTDVRINAFQNARGRLVYSSDIANDISNFINDKASSASINFPLPGGETINAVGWHEFYAFAQDEWRVRNGLTLTYGARYEYPGDTFSYLENLNDRILAANDNNLTFLYNPRPKADTNNFMPRVGFNWNPRTREKGILGFITGGDKLVVRGGYARTFDANFINLNANVFYSFPFTWTQNVSLSRAFTTLQNTKVPTVSQPNRVARTVFSEDFRTPASDQISFDIQRELTKDLLVQIGYVRTRGTGLFQTVDGNPCLPGKDCRSPNFGNRVNPNLEAINVRTNAASSTYDAMQASLTKRLSNNVSAGVHYTWSTFIDEVSDIFAASVSESAGVQDSFNRRADRARSGYDRPHRLTGNFVYELPFHSHQRRLVGHLLGGWQVNSFLTFQSGAPFTVFLSGTAGPSGNMIRPNLKTNLDLSSMTISEILAAGGANLFSALGTGQRVGNAGRNILRADSFRNVDIGIIKNTRLTENVRVQVWADFFNAFNSRNFGIPSAAINSPAFLNKWATDGGSRRIRLGARFVF